MEQVPATEEGEHVLPDGTKLYSRMWKVSSQRMTPSFGYIHEPNHE